MPVTGIGGFFFRAKDPKGLLAWYAEHLGIGTGPYGSWDTTAGPSLLLPGAADSNDDIEPGHHWRINFRVTEIDALIASLRAAAIEVTTKPEWDAPGVGRFARLHDPEGNQIELWEVDEPTS
jgi:predicted enzyme related to lactoylglutathione lyase